MLLPGHFLCPITEGYDALVISDTTVPYDVLVLSIHLVGDTKNILRSLVNIWELISSAFFLVA